MNKFECYVKTTKFKTSKCSANHLIYQTIHMLDKFKVRKTKMVPKQIRAVDRSFILTNHTVYSKNM